MLKKRKLFGRVGDMPTRRAFRFPPGQIWIGSDLRCAGINTDTNHTNRIAMLIRTLRSMTAFHHCYVSHCPPSFPVPVAELHRVRSSRGLAFGLPPAMYGESKLAEACFQRILQRNASNRRGLLFARATECLQRLKLTTSAERNERRFESPPHIAGLSAWVLAVPLTSYLHLLRNLSNPLSFRSTITTQADAVWFDFVLFRTILYDPT